jgi:hypothetical protein
MAGGAIPVVWRDEVGRISPQLRRVPVADYFGTFFSTLYRMQSMAVLSSSMANKPLITNSKLKVLGDLFFGGRDDSGQEQ